MVCSTFYECPVFLGSLCTRGFQIVLIKCVGFTEDMGVLGGEERTLVIALSILSFVS